MVLAMQVTQLTGFSDPVYAEAYVHVNQYDIVLDVLIVNQTNDTLQNLTLELATLGAYILFFNPHIDHSWSVRYYMHISVVVLANFGTYIQQPAATLNTYFVVTIHWQAMKPVTLETYLH